jgi:Tol biopolymer transport system component
MRQQQQKPAEKREMSLRPLTSFAPNSPALDSPAISPDGKYLAFCLKDQVFIQVIRSGEKRPLALPEGFKAGGVSWFPDGTKLLLNRVDEQPWYGSLWSMSFLGGAPQRILNLDHVQASSISPDGLLIAFGHRDLERNTSDLWLAGANGESQHRIRSSSKPGEYFLRPVWSSNG